MADKRENRSDFILYTSPDGDINVEVTIDDETVWLTQKAMAHLFGVDRSVITKHLQNVYNEGELDKKASSAKFAQVRMEGDREVTRKVEFYNLDAIISVGYRVNSSEATQFRIWATRVLREYILKGFALDDERLKQGNRIFGKDYFDELLERIREIRASERRFYQKITDIYSEASIDYDPKAKITRTFFQKVQNKLHWAITNQTAAEIIKDRADAKKKNMGLKTWKNAPDGKVLKSDTEIAKNYLDEDEISELNRIVSMYLDYAENQAKRQIPMKMRDWVERLDAFLKFNDYQVLDNPGKVSSKVAKKLAAKEYSKFRVVQDQEFESDFDKEVKKMLKKGKDKDE